MNKQKKILIVKMSAIGDVIHTLPALNAIRKQFPNARITWLVEEDAADIVLGHKALDRVIVSKRKKWIKELFSLKCGHALKNIRNFLKELRNTKYDMIIDFQTLFKSGVMVMLARGEKKIGFNKGMEHAESSHIFYNQRIPPVSMEIHALERGLLLLKSLNIPCKKIEYELPVTNQEKLNIESLLRQNDIDPEKPIICINPQATWETKLWDNKKFADLSLGKRVFKNIASILFEVAWSIHLNEKELMEHFTIKGIDNVKKAHEKGRGLIAVTCHYHFKNPGSSLWQSCSYGNH